MIFWYCSSKHDIPQRCSQPWLVGVLGGPVVPAHQPRQVIDGNRTQRSTVSTSWNRGFAVRPQQSVQQASLVWISASLATNFFPGGIWIHISFLYFFFINANVFDAATIFVHLLRYSSSWRNCVLLKVLLVVKEKTYVYGPSRALGKKH